MKRYPLVFALVTCALIVGSPEPVSAGSHRIADPAPETKPLEQECRPQAARRQLCHVHRHETFERLPKNDPALADPHARQEYLLELRKARGGRARDATKGPSH